MPGTDEVGGGRKQNELIMAVTQGCTALFATDLMKTGYFYLDYVLAFIKHYKV
jgi:hypothetical protein